MDYQSLAAQIALKYNLNPELYLKQIAVESGFNPTAVSPAGAVGLGQLMPQTAQRFGVTNPLDPVQNLEGSAKYMRLLLNRYNGNYKLALAGYNAGEGAVDKYKGLPPYKETQDYVNKILSNPIGLPTDQQAPSVESSQMPTNTLPNIKDLTGLLGTQNSGLGVGDALMMLGNPAVAPTILNNQRIRESNNLALLQSYLKIAGGSDLTAIEKELKAAGYVPGTPDYQAALKKYIFQSKAPSVTVYNDAASLYKPEGSLGPVNPKDASQGYLFPDPGSPTGTKIVKPTGATQTTAPEVTAVGSLETAKQSINSLEDLLTKKDVNFGGIPGVVSEFLNQPSFVPAALNPIADKFGFQPTEDTTKAIVEAAKIRNILGQMLSGADVPETQLEEFKKFMPAAGEPNTVTKAKLDGLKKMLQNYDEAGGKLRQRPDLSPATSVTQPSTPKSPGMNMDEFNQRLKAYGLK
jgi:hypothetical protein